LICVSIPYRDDKNCIIFFPYATPFYDVSIPYRDDKNIYGDTCELFGTTVSIPYRDDKN